MKKIIFCDIDGTIIDGSRNMMEVSDKTKYAIKELSKDNYVFIASGRCKGLLEKEIFDLNPNGFILCNGAYAEIDNKEIFAQYFLENAVKDIIDVTEKYNGFYVFESLNRIFVNDLNAPAFIKFLKGWGPAIKRFEARSNLDERYHIAMVGFTNEQDCLNAEKELSKSVLITRHHNFMSYDCNILGIDKGYGVNKVMEYLNISKENAYCFGDGLNDLEMLKAVGHPVIVANADEKLKKYGFEETLDVLQDGFYHYLVKNKLIKAL